MSDASRRGALTRRLARSGVNWRARRYHRRPTVPATLLDAAVGAREIVRWSRRRGGARLLHLRGYVPGLMGLVSRGMHGGSKLVFDTRSFMVDERIESGMWRPDLSVVRLARAVERRLLVQCRCGHGGQPRRRARACRGPRIRRTDARPGHSSLAWISIRFGPAATRRREGRARLGRGPGHRPCRRSEHLVPAPIHVPGRRGVRSPLRGHVRGSHPRAGIRPLTQRHAPRGRDGAQRRSFRDAAVARSL